MRSVWTLAMKDLRLLLADKVGFFFVWIYPIIFVIFFGLVTSGMYKRDGGLKAIPIVIVDEDGTDGAQEFAETLAAHDALALEPAEDRTAGETLVRRGQKAACVIIKEGFGAARERIFWGEPMEIDVITDPSRPMEAGTTQGLVQGHKRWRGLRSGRLRDRAIVVRVGSDAAMGAGRCGYARAKSGGRPHRQ